MKSLITTTLVVFMQFALFISLQIQVNMLSSNVHQLIEQHGKVIEQLKELAEGLQIAGQGIAANNGSIQILDRRTR